MQVYTHTRHICLFTICLQLYLEYFLHYTPLSFLASLESFPIQRVQNNLNIHSICLHYAVGDLLNSSTFSSLNLQWTIPNAERAPEGNANFCQCVLQ